MGSKKAGRGFNRIAPYYDFLAKAFFGNSIHNAANHYIDAIPKCGKVLLFGDGTGHVLCEMLRQGKAAEYLFVDFSEEMIARAKKKAETMFPEKMQHIQFLCAGYDDIPATYKADAIATPFVLDCFPNAQLPKVVATLHTHLEPGGLWLFSDFNIPEKPLWMKLAAKVLVGGLYLFFNIVCRLKANRLPVFDKAFAELDYMNVGQKHFLNGLLVSTCYQKKETLSPVKVSKKRKEKVAAEVY
jgi:ubiquinone/menaquinone biosynthesis C-methylase UbiE